MWSLNWLGRKTLILSIYFNRLIHRVWYLNFGCPVVHLKLSAEDLGIQRRIWAWISGLVCKSPANVVGPDFWFQAPRPKIWGLFYESRLKPRTGYQDPGPRVSDVRPDIWNSDIRQNVVISHGRKPTYLILWFEKKASNMKIQLMSTFHFILLNSKLNDC